MPEYVSSMAPSPLPPLLLSALWRRKLPLTPMSPPTVGILQQSPGISAHRQLGSKWANSKFYEAAMFIPPAVPLGDEGAGCPGGKQEMQPRKAFSYREQVFHFPLAQQGVGLGHSGEVGKPVRVAGAP